jgi:hypothetical protein
MSQRALRSRTVDTVSEEIDLGSRERSPDLEEIAIERVRPGTNEENDEAKGGQSVTDVEVSGMQSGSSDKDKSSKGNKVTSSEMTIIINMLQQLSLRLDQQFQEFKEEQKQAQEKTDQQLQELKEGQKHAQEKTDQQFQEMKGQKQVQERVDTNTAETTNAIVVLKENANAIQERLSKVEGISNELLNLNSSVQQIQQKLEDNVSEASRHLREQGRQIEQKSNQSIVQENSQTFEIQESEKM